jgi:hypothetical protein
MSGRLNAMTVAVLVIVSVCSGLASIAKASRLASPSTVYRTLSARSLWKANLPHGFGLAKTSSERLRDKGLVGDIAVQLKGPWAGQGFGFIVTDSTRYAQVGLHGLLKGNHAKPSTDGRPGTGEWQATERGPSSACDSPKVRCYEAASAVRVDETIVTAVIGASKPIDPTAKRQVAELLTFAIAALHRAGG